MPQPVKPEPPLRRRVLDGAEMEWRRRASLRRFVDIRALLRLAAALAIAFALFSNPLFQGGSWNPRQLFAAFQSPPASSEDFGNYERFCEEIDYDKNRAHVALRLAHLAEGAKSAPVE